MAKRSSLLFLFRHHLRRLPRQLVPLLLRDVSIVDRHHLRRLPRQLVPLLLRDVSILDW
jgi:hypothetical protein